MAAPQQTAISCSTPQFLVVRRAPLGGLGPAGCRLGPARKGWCWGLPRLVHVPLPVRPLTSWGALPPRLGAKTATRPWSVFRRPRQASGFLEVLSDQPCSTRNKGSEESAPQVWWLAAQAQRGSAGLCPALICPTPPDTAPADAQPSTHGRGGASAPEIGDLRGGGPQRRTFSDNLTAPLSSLALDSRSKTNPPTAPSQPSHAFS